MSEKILKELADEIGPETMVYVYDPDTDMKAVLVVDTFAYGAAGGGTRMLPDITEEEIFGLARAMTYKFAILGLPRDGCKAGVWGDPFMPKEEKGRLMRALGKALQPYLADRKVSLATDMGISGSDLDLIYEGVGISPPGRAGLAAQEKDGEPLENHFTGYGVVVSIKEACKIAGLPLNQATMAIEGFGKVGGGVLRYASQEGAKVVAVSTMYDGIYNQDGLDKDQLFELRKKFGDKCLSEYKDAEHIAPDQIYFLPCDILVPGARPFVLTEENLDRVRAKIISSGANTPTTLEAEKMFFARGTWVVPDFIANSGGTISALVNYLNGTAEQAFKAIENQITHLTVEILTEAGEKNLDPYTIALEKCKQRILAARKQPEKLTFDQALQQIKGRLGVF